MRRQRINQLTDTSAITSLFQWIELLNFVEDTKDLTLDELRQLAQASEVHRKYWNETVSVKTCTVKNGQKIFTTKTRNSLDIRREDVTPNIHRQLEQLELSLRRESIKPKQHNIESTPLQVAVA